jgi:hypothetical protein
MLKVGVYTVRCTYGSSPLHIDIMVFALSEKEAEDRLKASGYATTKAVGFVPR